MKRRRFLARGTAGATAGAAALAAPNIAGAQGQPRVRWRCPGSFPKSLDTLYGTQEHLAKRVGEMTDGAFQIQVFGPGEVVPALQVLDAVGGGTVECGFTSAYYYLGKDPSLAIATCLPFGLSTKQHWAWLTHGGARQLYAEVYRDQGVVAIPAGNTGSQMGGWFRKEIKSVEDLKGLKFRIAGYGGNALQKLGVIPQQLGGPDIYPALERGVIDAAEWVGPYDDEKLGFAKVAPFYYYPGFWEGGPSIHLFINQAKWKELPKAYQAILTTAAGYANSDMLAKYDARNPAALRRLLGAGTQLRPFSPEILEAAYKAANEVYDDVSSKNADFKKIYDSVRGFRNEEYLWFQVAEYAFDNFMIRARARG